MTAPGRPLSELRDTGLLWAINTMVMHPRGFALALHYEGNGGDGEPTGWSLIGDGTEPWVFRDEDTPEPFKAFERLLAEHREQEPT